MYYLEEYFHPSRLDVSTASNGRMTDSFKEMNKRSAAALLLGSGVQIPLIAWNFVSCVCCVGSGRCDELITRPEESYSVCVCVCVCDIEISTLN
jgi:hypothetical protein